MGRCGAEGSGVMTEATHGGAREGAGRKPGWRKPGAKRIIVNVKLSEAERDLAVELGAGNASAGIRRALAVAENHLEEMAGGD